MFSMPYALVSVTYETVHSSVDRGGDDKDDSGDEGDAENKKFKDQLSGLFVIIAINMKPITKSYSVCFMGTCMILVNLKQTIEFQ